jgi:hypothetical protein
MGGFFFSSFLRILSIMSSAKQIIIFGVFLVFVVFQGYAQTSNNSLLPYNPDIDGNGTIEVTDLMGFLPLFGASYIAEGTLPIANGGTGATNVDEARLALTISVFSDLSPVEGVSSGGQVSGTLNITGTLTQGGGSDATGLNAVATGNNSIASGDNSQASNKNCVASGDCSVAQGESTTSIALASHAEGMLTYSSGLSSHSEGMQTLAQGDYSHSEGFQTEATNISAHAEGYGTEASGLYSHAENRFSIATHTCAHAEGEGTSALADAAHSEGLGTVASGFASHAEGYQSIASGGYSHAGGRSTLASATGSTAMGHGLIADQQYSSVVGKFNQENRSGTLFVVGNGASASIRTNIFEITSYEALLNGDLNVNGLISLNGLDLGAGVQTNQIDIQMLMSEIQVLQLIVADLQDQIDLLTP